MKVISCCPGNPHSSSPPTPPLLPHPRHLSSYRANWRQALWVGRTIGPTVEWHLRLNGWTGERKIAGVFFKNHPPSNTPPHLNPFLCPLFIPRRLIQIPTWHSSTSEPRAYELKQQLFIWCGTNVRPGHCEEIWSDVGIVFGLLCVLA